MILIQGHNPAFWNCSNPSSGLHKEGLSSVHSCTGSNGSIPFGDAGRALHHLKAPQDPAEAQPLAQPGTLVKAVDFRHLVVSCSSWLLDDMRGLRVWRALCACAVFHVSTCLLRLGQTEAFAQNLRPSESVLAPSSGACCCVPILRETAKVPGALPPGTGFRRLEGSQSSAREFESFTAGAP